jgi:hypothetical protein
MKMPYPRHRVIRESVRGFATRSRANSNLGARSDAKPEPTLLIAPRAERQAEGNIDEY